MTQGLRFGLLAAGLLMAALGSAQLGAVGDSLSRATKVFPRTPFQQKNPLEPTGFPGLPPKEGTLPPPRDFDESERFFRILQSDKSEQNGRDVIATGGVHARYKGYDLFGSTLEGNHDTEIYTLSGDVKVIGKDSVITGRKVTVFMKTNKFLAEDAESQLAPTFLKGNVLDDVYVRSRLMEGSEREVHSHDGGFTTCNLEHPHFEILAESTTIRPTKRVILRTVRVQLFGRTLLSLPYLNIPLDQRGDRYLPEVGQSQDEGYYIKFKYPIPLKGNRNTLTTRFHYMTKLGTGIGADLTYDNATSGGSVRVFSQFGPQNRSYEIYNQHRQQIKSLTIDVSNQITSQSYLTAPENTIVNSTVNLYLQQHEATSSFSYFRNSNEGPSFSYLQQTLTLGDQRNFKGGFRTDLSATMTSNVTTFSGTDDIKREQLDVAFRGSKDLLHGTAELEYRRSIPIGVVDNFFGSTDRTPVLSYRTTSPQLMGKKWATVPIQMQFSLGEYLQPGQVEERLSRGAIELAFAKSTPSDKRWVIDLGGSYKQTVYSNDTAQYVTGFTGGARYNLSPRGRTYLNFRYAFLEPHGFTPFSFDQTGNYNLATLDLNVSPLRNWEIGAQTGYDFRQEYFQQTAWQSIGIRSTWTPTDYFQLRGVSTYDTFNKSWSNVRLDLAYNPGATTLGIGARYDAFRHTWGNVNIYLDNLKMGRLKMSTILVYNGYLKQFEARHFNFTYDLHCAEAIFQIIDNQVGYRPGTQFAFFVRLKALPFDTPFGTGRRGQSFGTGTGVGF